MMILMNTPISFRQYLKLMLKRSTWGEDIVVYAALSTLFKLKITQSPATGKDWMKYRCRHDPTSGCMPTMVSHSQRDNHYSFAGKWTLVHYLDVYTGRS